jgi:CspA family cold shock protein
MTETMMKSGQVKWYSRDRGYGYIAVDGDCDVFLDCHPLRAFGVLEVAPESAITVEAINTERGWRATKVVDLEMKKAPEVITRHVIISDVTPQHERATFKWFDPMRGFGFLTQEDRPDIFVHASTLKRCGIATIEPGQPVLVKHGQSPRGRIAVDVHADAH